MSAATAKSGFQPTDTDVHISLADQQHINQFAKLNAKHEDLKDEVKIRENDLKNLEDAAEEIELFDEDEMIPYLSGEVFISQSLEATKKSLEQDRTTTMAEIKEFKEKMATLEAEMSELKVILYGKFGNQINLEPDE